MTDFIQPLDVDPLVPVWKVSLQDDSQLDRSSRLLAADEQQRAAQFKFDKDRRRFVLARGALRTLLGEQSGERAEELRFAYGKYGRPELVHPHCPGLDFNLAHSGDWAVVAIATARRVGIDLERIRPGVDMLRIAQRHFSQAEFDLLGCLSADEQPLAFFRCWTRKEAHLKALGCGFFGERHESPTQEWRLIEFEPADGYVGALAVGAGESALPKLEPEYTAQQSWTAGVDDDRPQAGVHGSPQ